MITPTHPSCAILNEKDEFIRVMFLPPNVTSLLQPMNQGVIETQAVLQKIIVTFEKKEEREESLIKKKTIQRYMIRIARDSVKEQILKTSVE